MNDRSQAGASNDRTLSPIREVDIREWWLWGLAVAVTLVLTFGILSLTFPGLHWASDEVHSQTLKEWVRGLRRASVCCTNPNVSSRLLVGFSVGARLTREGTGRNKQIGGQGALLKRDIEKFLHINQN